MRERERERERERRGDPGELRTETKRNDINRLMRKVQYINVY